MTHGVVTLVYWDPARVRWLHITPGMCYILQIYVYYHHHYYYYLTRIDFTAFLDHLGIASVDMGFGGNYSGVYHSIYDSVHWMEAFGKFLYTFINC